MGYFSDYYLEEFTTDLVKQFLILLNEEKIHENQKYLLIVAQDLVTDKIVKLVDTHGIKYDLCKHSDDWAKLNKGDIISLKCCFHKSEHCVNVLRIKSNYTLEDSLDFNSELNEVFDIFDTKSNSKIKIFNTDLEFLAKKLAGKYGFITYYLNGCELVEYRTTSNKIKYQFCIDCFSKKYYADVLPYVADVQKRIGEKHYGYVLLQFAYKNERLRVKVYDFLVDGFFEFSDDVLPF